MYYKINNNVALRKWKYVDRAVYVKGVDHALNVSKEEWELLLLCDSNHNIAPDPYLANLLSRKYISQCEKGDEPSEWSKLKEYSNYYFPKMNIMITGKCNLNCLHCFNAKDNAPLNTEWDYEELLHLLDEAKDIGVHAFTITGGEPMVHPHFMDIVRAIYERDMYIFELNTNGFLITQEMLDEFKRLNCHPLMKISYDGIGYHNWIRQNPKADELTIKAIKLCIANGFDVKVQTQVNAKNIDSIMETVKMLDSLGVSITRLIRTTEAPRWEKNSPGSSLSYHDYFEKMLEFAKEYLDSGIEMSVDIWQFMTLYPHSKSYSLSAIQCNAKEFNVRIPMCRGIRGMIGVSSSGEIVPCLQMSGWLMEKGVSLGNVRQTPLKELVTQSDYLNCATATLFNQIVNNDKCSSCDYYKACTGGCPALGLLYSHKHFDFYHEDLTKCYFFENGWYEKCMEALKDYQLLNPLQLDED